MHDFILNEHIKAVQKQEEEIRGLFCEKFITAWDDSFIEDIEKYEEILNVGCKFSYKKTPFAFIGDLKVETFGMEIKISFDSRML